MGHNSIWLVSQRLLQYEHLKGGSWRHSKREIIFKQKMISGETTLATNWEMLIFLWSKLLSLCHFATKNHTSWYKSSGDCLRPSSHFLTFADLERGHKGFKICCRGSSTLTHFPSSSNTILFFFSGKHPFLVSVAFKEFQVLRMNLWTHHGLNVVSIQPGLLSFFWLSLELQPKVQCGDTCL